MGHLPEEPEPAPILSCEEVQFVAGRSRILNGVSLSVYRGEKVAVVGKSGAGKSTLLNVLSGLQPPTSGAVSWGGDDVYSMTEPKFTEVRRIVCGYLYQFPVFLEDLTVLDNVLLPRRLARSTERVTDRSRAVTLCDRIGIGDLIDEFPVTLSGGELQRVSVIRALISQPSIIFADEPTGALDDANAKAVFALLDELRAEFDAALVYVTHDTGLAENADRVLMMSDGILSAS